MQVRARRSDGSRVGARGQATVEAAFLIPVLFVCLLLLLQPGILLYDRLVMEAAAIDGCRLLATRSSDQGIDEEEFEQTVLRHLGAIPSQDLFHCHDGGCTWEIDLAGDESDAVVSVTISNELEPLPLVDAGLALFGATNAEGHLELAVTRSMPTQPGWVEDSELGIDPDAWASHWD